MTSQPSNSITSYVPSDIIVPDDPKALKRFLDDLFKQIIDALNDKEIGHYNTVEEVIGQKYFTAGDTQNFKGIYRKVVDFGALPNTAAKTVAHGITVSASTIFTHIYATATEPSNGYIPIPYVDPLDIANAIELYVDAANVGIVTGADYSAYTTCYVVLEWIQ